MKEDIAIVGAGLAGSLLAIMLAEEDHDVTVYEKRGDLRLVKHAAGRSINLALSHRGLLALEKVGLRDAVKSLLIPMEGRLIHDVEGNTQFQPYGKDTDEVINSISRLELNKFLLSTADRYENITLQFDTKIVEYNPVTNILQVERPSGAEHLPTSRVVGADGAYSVIRQAIMPLGRFDYSQNYLDYGYKELEIPPGDDGEFRIQANALHIWPRKQFLMIALPNPDKTFTCTLFAPYEGENSFAQLSTADEITRYFEVNFPDAVPHMPDLVADFHTNPLGKLVTMKCNPWHYNEQVVLVGDAAHAIIPFYGQGMNAAFEDCRILTELIASSESWSAAIEQYSRVRKPNGDAIAGLSYDNFVEMRDKVADKQFLLRKQAELKMYELYDDIISKYAMVTFHPEIPYADAKLKGEILEETIAELFVEISDLDKFDPNIARRIVLEKYSNLASKSE